MSDLIDRQAALDAVRKLGFKQTSTVKSIICALEVVPVVQQEQGKLVGWICPVCGRGLSPFTSVCPCNKGEGWEITC